MKLITLDNLKTFLDKLLEQISTDVYTKHEVDEKLSKMNPKSDGYSKAEIDEKLKEIKKINNNSDADKFFDWLKERNYNMKNFKGLENAFPILTFIPLKFNPPTAGTNDIHGTGSPNTIIEFDSKKYEINDEGNWKIVSDKPFKKGITYKLNYYNYSNKCNLLSFEVVDEDVPIKYSIPPEDNITVVTADIVKKYNLKDDAILPPTVIKIDDNCFYYNFNIKSVKSLSATTINKFAFRNCSSLTSISLPNATSIGLGAFRNCSSLTSISLPNATSIGLEAFRDCSSLTSISLPNATSIGFEAFRDCNKLAIIVANEKANYNIFDSICLNNTCIIYNQDKSKKFNKSTKQWENV